MSINAFDVYETFYFTKRDSRSSCFFQQTVKLYQKFAVIAKILLAPHLHACDTFLAAANAEFCRHAMVLQCRFQYAQ